MMRSSSPRLTYRLRGGAAAREEFGFRVPYADTRRCYRRTTLDHDALPRTRQGLRIAPPTHPFRVHGVEHRAGLHRILTVDSPLPIGRRTKRWGRSRRPHR